MKIPAEDRFIKAISDQLAKDEEEVGGLSISTSISTICVWMFEWREDWLVLSREMDRLVLG
ncbi:hypothetical protein PanWU01x14_154360 [Parasponia andersonii]|uniref:Uncharacterized protein n=1 Tax=Parasponia andersonii TaxID=3476 RepID=A0A2P5CGV1_PARAD|nr:hypothetical protein PanWU01x14_154360 [Parasponia andersonii]